MASAPDAPTSVSTFESEPVLSKSPSVSLSEPELRSMVLLVVRADSSVIVSALLPPVMALDVGDGRAVGEVAERDLVGAGAEVDRGLGSQGRERDGVSTRAADQRLDVRERAGVGDVGERQLVAAGAEVDAVRADDGSAEGERVVGRAADERLDVRDRRHVGEVAEDQLVGARVEIDRGLRRDGAERDRVRSRTAAEDALDVRDRGRVGERRRASGCRCRRRGRSSRSRAGSRR